MSDSTRPESAPSTGMQRFAWLPIAILLAAMAALWAADLPGSYGSNSFIMALNFIFSTLTSGVVVYLVSRSFLTKGDPGLLMMGCGVLAWGTAGVLAKVANHGDVNLDVTIHNACVWFSALFHFSSALLFLWPKRTIRARVMCLFFAYISAFAVMVLVAIAAFHGDTPTFFVQGMGGTNVRQFILGSAILMFLSTAGILKAVDRRPQSVFLNWYTLALCLITIGIFGLMIESVFASLLSWTGLTAQFLSGVYMLIAAIFSVRESGTWHISLEVALRQSEERLALAASATRIGMFDWDLIKGSVLWTQTHEAIFGYAPASTTTTTTEHHYSRWADRVHPDDLPLIEEELRRCIQERKPLEMQYRIIWPDGSLHWVETRGVFQYDSNGNASRMLGVVIDISERKNAEETIAHEKYLQQLLLDNFPGVVLLLRTATREVVASNMAGKNIGAVCGSICFETWGQNQNPCPWCLATDLWATGKEQHTILEAAGKVWEPHWVPVTDDLYMHYALDITESKQAEEKLQEKDRLIQQALSISNSFTFDWDIGTDQVLRSTSCKSAFGPDGDKICDATAKKFSELIHPDDRQRFETLVRNLTPDADTYTMDFRLVLSDGSIVTLGETAQAFFDADGKINRIIGVSTDISLRKQAEDAILRNQKIFHELIERSPFGTYVVDSQFRIAIMNTASQAGAFRNVQPLIGRDFSEAIRILWPEEVAVEIIGHFRRTLDSGEPYCSRDFINRRHDDDIVEAYEWELHRMTLPDGQHGVICYYYDSTELRQAEAALRESEERLRLLGDNLPESAVYQYVHEPDGSMRFIHVSAGIERLNGVIPYEVLRDASVLHRQIPPEYVERLIEAEAHSKRELSDLNMDLPMHRPDGEMRWMRLRSRPRRMPDGSTVWDGVQTDITERKHAEESLRESQERLVLAADAGQIGMFDLNMASGDLQWTQQHEVIFGYEPTTTTTRTYRDWADRVHPEDLPMVEGRMRQAMEERVPFQVEYRLVWPDNSLHWVNVTSKYYFDDSGRCTRLMGAVRDITNQKLAEQALQESEAQLRSLADSISNLAWWANNDGYITWYNKRWYEYTGTTPEQMEGWGWQSVHDPDELPKVLERWQTSIATGEPFEMIFPLRGADGVFRKFLTRSIPLKDAAGSVQQWFGTNTDVNELEQCVAERTKELAATINHLLSEIHERKMAEKKLLAETTVRLQATEALREKERMLIQQSRQAAMGEMIGNIAHQWRQPLNILGLYTQKLGLFYGTPNFNKDFLDNSIAKSMEIIKHMSKTIDDFRDYFKPEKEKTDFYVIEAIKSTMSLLEGNFHNPNIVIEFVDRDNPVIHGYQNEFAQVFLNILNNARDAIIEREISDAKVTITICSENNCVVVTVADNAGGIPDEFINKVFDPYFTTKGPQVGTGIGLFMSKTIIEKNMGGRLSVRNTETGAEFKIEVEHGTQY